MKFKSHIFAQVSGSIAGTTFAHNQGGLYARARTIPVNPSTPQQTVVRNIMRDLSQEWSQTLNEASRQSWANYADNNPRVDTLGNQLSLSGQQMFIRCNSVRRRANLSAVQAGPTAQGLAPLTDVTIQPNANLTTITATFNTTDQWANEDQGAMIIFISKQITPARNFFKGPFLAAGLVFGNSTTPPTSPLIFSNQVPEVYLAGNKVFARTVAVLTDGRISSTLYTLGIAA